MAAGLFVWGFGAIFYMMGFFHRVAPAVITGELMVDFQIGATVLGNLSAFYFYSYVAMQIPTGILADRFGPRLLLTIGALVASSGAVVFAISPSVGWAAAGRLLIGGSVAVAFVGLLKLATQWFAPQRFALISGLALFFGVVGAVFAGTPLRLMVDAFGWRQVVMFSAVATLAIAVSTWVFVRDFPSQKGFCDFPGAPASSGKKLTGPIIDGIRRVFAYRNTWLLCVIPGGMVGCVLAFSGLWGVPYLTTMYGIPSAKAALLTSALMVAWAIGGPFFGWLSDRLKNRKTVYISGCIIAVAGWQIIILIQNMSLPVLTVVLLVTGFFSGSMIISFAFAKESVPAELAGTISGVVNMGVMTGPMILQPTIGWILDFYWTGEMMGGARIYSATAYKMGFSLMLAWISISLVFLVFSRETGCRQQV